MIKPSHLRLGNWVKHEDRYLEISEIHYKMVGCIHCWGFEDIEVEGIPLTPEILEAVGFIHTNTLHDGTMSFKGTPYVYFKEGAITVSASARKYKYLHELQNLIFCLTGQELTIKTITDENGRNI